MSDRGKAIIWINAGLLSVCTLRNKFQWNFNHNTKILFTKCIWASEHIVYKMAAILSRPQYVISTFCLCILPVLKQYLSFALIHQLDPHIPEKPKFHDSLSPDIVQVYFQTRKGWYIEHFLWNWSSASATEPHWWSTLLQLMAWCCQEKQLPEPMLTFLCCHMMSQWVNAIDQSHRCGHRQAACREPAGSYDKTIRTAICFEHKTQYLLIRVLYTPIVVQSNPVFSRAVNSRKSVSRACTLDPKF